MKTIKWLSRVPLTVAYAKQLVSEVLEFEFIKSQIEGYSYVVKRSSYGSVEQRWLVVESASRKNADLKQLEKRILKSEMTAQKKIQKLSSEIFECRQSAIKAVEKLSKQLQYHTIKNIEIIKQPRQLVKKSINSTEKLNPDRYQIKANLERCETIK